MLFRKLLRTVGRYKAQFISMIIMIAIGIGMFLGFNMEWVSIDRNTREFLKDTHFADYRIVSDEGFTKEDAEKIASAEGVNAASRFLSFNADVDGTDNMVGLTVTENPEVSDFLVMEGEAYDPKSKDGIWLFDHYAEENNVKLGDEMVIKYEKMTVKGTVKGLIESGEYMICVRDESQLMPDFKTYGYAYISPVMFEEAVKEAAQTEISDEINEAFGDTYGAEFFSDLIDSAVPDIADSISDDKIENIYPQINVLSDMSKEEFAKKADETLGETLMILSKDETASYSESQGEVEEGKTMGSILPVLFLLIAVLTMVTTMHRLTANEKTQIGTLKALGFRDKRILMHYTSFAFVIGIAGSVIGTGLGYLIAYAIMNPNGMMGTYIVMPKWTIYLPVWCWIITIGIIIMLTFIGFLSTRTMLKGTAADALRPYSPKKFKRLFIERFKVLEKLSFGTKWNLRDVLRHKSRSLMTVFGIFGCTVLIIAAFCMSDTMKDFMSSYFNDIAMYESKIFLADDVKDKKALQLAEEFNGDAVAPVSVQIDDEPVSLDVYYLKHDTVRFLTEDNERLTLDDDGAFVCLRMRDKYDLKIGDSITVSPYGTDENYTLRIKGFNRSLSESISISDAYAKKLESEGTCLPDSEMYHISTIYTDMNKSEISGSDISSVQSKQDIIDSMDGFMEILYTMVVILIIAAVILGIIVLYNLGIMSYTERYREMATLKVVGFRDRQIGRLLISQNIWLSVLGIVLGIPAGGGILVILLKMLASEYEMKAVIGIPSVILSIVITMSVTLIVGLIIARKNKKIEMVEALKTPE